MAIEWTNPVLRVNPKPWFRFVHGIWPLEVAGTQPLPGVGQTYPLWPRCTLPHCLLVNVCYEQHGHALDPDLSEKIERFQDIMTASITGGERDDIAYTELRKELFEVPRLKEALPRFVRTCRNLGQLWDYIKTEENLPSYASRRMFMKDALDSLLSEIDVDATDREAFFVKGANHDAYTYIRSLLQLAKTALFIIDPYMDGSIYQMLGTVTAAPICVQIMTSKVPSDFGLEGKKFVKQHPGFTLEIRKTKDFHDRFIIVDDAKCYLLGASIKDAGNKGFTIVPMEDLGIVTLIKKYADQTWTAATAL